MTWYPTRRKSNKMVNTEVNPVQPITSLNPLETIMNLLGFVKVNFAIVPNPQPSTIVMGLDNDGKLKIKDEYGRIYDVKYM
jgi:hypothetical protein